MRYGTIQCRVRIEDEEHQYATLIEDDYTALESSESGAFRMLWRTRVTRENALATALVHFPTATVVEGQVSSGFKIHSHFSGSHSDGGYAVAVFAPGTGVPAKPFE